jgi:sterol desaturase/sphingolipid hydroxylase (fatty acid hydroxylase superfamily)
MMASEGSSIAGLTMLVTLAASVLFAELVGYLLHRLLHSDRLPALSRSHLIHHLALYGPLQPMRSPVYKNATDDRPSLGNIGMEWIGPIAVVLALTWGTLTRIGVALPYRVVSLVTMVFWPLFMFSYLHDRMHLQNFWMERAPLLKCWFLRARRLHDIHHHSLNDGGRMDHNFGIGFFLFDRIFGTLAKRHCPLNRHGYRAALRRYKLERRDDEDFSDFPSCFRV